MREVVGASIGIILFLTLYSPVHGFADTQTDPTKESDQPNYAKTSIAQISCNNLSPPGDLDGDGICDAWEFGNSNPEPGTGFRGLHVTFADPSYPTVTYEYKLPCVKDTTYGSDPLGTTVCPDRNKKDLYLELDWMTNHAPSDTALQHVVNAFVNSPVTNINGALPGVYLHIQKGEASGNGDIGKHYNYVKWTTISGAPYIKVNTLKQNHFGTQAEHVANNSQCPNPSIPTGVTPFWPANVYNCLTAKRQIFHYGLFVNKQYGQDTVSGLSEIIGNDFIVSLGSFGTGNGDTSYQEAALMHELGHNLGLRHSGGAPPSGYVDDDLNCKPNYLSVMSYTFEFSSSYDSCRPLDYMHLPTPQLNSLTEQTTLQDSAIGSYPYPTGTASSCSANYPERPIFYARGGTTITGYSGVEKQPPPPKNDWNGDGQNANTYSQNLNNLGITGCNNANAWNTLDAFDDWGHLNFVFQTSSNFFGGSVPMNTTSVQPTAYSYVNDVGYDQPLCLPEQSTRVQASDDPESSGGEITCREMSHDDVTKVRADRLDGILPSLHLLSSNLHYNAGKGFNETILKYIEDAKAASAVDDFAVLNESQIKIQEYVLGNSALQLKYSEKQNIQGFFKESQSHYYVVPEFGNIAMIVLALSFFCITLFAKKIKLNRL